MSLSNTVLELLPELSECPEDGTFRLKLMADTPHVCAGTYTQVGLAIAFNNLSGRMTQDHLLDLLESIETTTPCQVATGYYFIHEGDEDDKFVYSHYYIGEA